MQDFGLFRVRVRQVTLYIICIFHFFEKILYPLQNKIKSVFFYCFYIYIYIDLFIRGGPFNWFNPQHMCAYPMPGHHMLCLFVFNDVIDRDRGLLLFVFPEH
jgi:hypothetical protein